jgi:hypothetical protein
VQSGNAVTTPRVLKRHLVRGVTAILAEPAIPGGCGAAGGCGAGRCVLDYLVTCKCVSHLLDAGLVMTIFPKSPSGNPEVAEEHPHRL